MVHNSGKMKIIIIVVLAALLLISGVAIVMIKVKKPSKPVKPPTAEMALGEFIVNLADQNEVRYLKANVVLEIEGPAPAAAEGGGEGGSAGDPRVRDAVIQVMSSKHFAELTKPEGKEELKKEMIEAINKCSEEKAKEGSEEKGLKAVGVFFNEFAMQ